VSNQSEVRSQDTVSVIGGVTGSAEGRELAWKFVQDQWPELYERFSSGFLLARLVKVGTNDIETYWPVGYYRLLTYDANRWLTTVLNYVYGI